jgi:phosphoenolpyruvate---glycerone phosphotransferase subunit DhaL
MEKLNARDIQAIFAMLDRTMAEKREFLIQIDAQLGDGDLGITMSKGFSAANSATENSNQTDVGLLMVSAGMAISQAAPSTMGTLMATGFLKAGKSLSGKTEVDLQRFSTAMNEFVEGVMNRGKAKPGEKTIVDSLLPAVEALKNSSASNLPMNQAFSMAYEAAVLGLEQTKEMVPQHGKQVAHRAKSKGLEDPGATVGMLIFQVFSEYVNAQ